MITGIITILVALLLFGLLFKNPNESFASGVGTGCSFIFKVLFILAVIVVAIIVWYVCSHG